MASDPKKNRAQVAFGSPFIPAKALEARVERLVEPKPAESPHSHRAALMVQARAMLAAGLCFIPADRKTKRPSVRWKEYQSRRPTMEEALEWFNCEDCAETGSDAIAVVAGDVSGGLECLDFDCQAVAFEQWSHAVEETVPGVLERLVVVKTQSGGRHVLYRCPGHVTGNESLAEHFEPLGKDGLAHFMGKTATACKARPGFGSFKVIETRGEGGYFLTAPSAGYTVEQGKVTEPPLVSDVERAAFMMCATARTDFENASKTWLTLAAPGIDPEQVAANPQQMKQHAAQAPATVRRTDGEREGISPIDAYNHQPGVEKVVLGELKAAGWTLSHETEENYHLTRPGKGTAEGSSATLRKKDGLLYNFSSNSPGFSEKEHATPAHVFATLHHGGNHTMAASALRKMGFGDGGGVGSKRMVGEAEQEAEQPPQPRQPEQEAAMSMECVRLALQARQGQRFVGIDVPDMPLLSKRLDGFMGYTLLSGDSGTGKTVMACSIALSVAGLRLPDPDRQHASEEQAAAGSGVKVIYVASELGRTEILLRMLGVLSGIHNFGLRKGIPTEEPRGSLRLRQTQPRSEAVEAAFRALSRLQAANHLTVLEPEDYQGAWTAGEHCLQRLADACERTYGSHERVLVVVDSMDALEVHQSGQQRVDYRDGLSEDSAKVVGLQRWRKWLGSSGAILLLQEESKAAAGSGQLHAGRGSSKLPYRADAVVQVMKATAMDGQRPVGTLALGLRQPPATDQSSRRVSPLDLVVNKARGGARGIVCVDFIPSRERMGEWESFDAHEVEQAQLTHKQRVKTEREEAKKKAATERKGSKVKAE